MDRFDPTTCEMESFTVVDTVCPICRERIRFVDPNHIGLASFQVEMDHYKRECQRLYGQIHRMEQIIDKLLHPCQPPEP